jgi:hypothetical protein
MIDDDDYGAVVGRRIGRGNRSTWRKPAPFCPPQIPHDNSRYMSIEVILNGMRNNVLKICVVGI